MGAAGGFSAFMEHLAPAFAATWRALARWEQIGPGEVAPLAEAVDRTYGTQGRAALEAERDHNLQALLRVLQNKEADS